MTASGREADALVTATPGMVLGVLTADCGPVLFADPKAGVIGAAHAGWKGALDGVLENTIEAMVTLGADAKQHRRLPRPVDQPAQLRGRPGIRRALRRTNDRPTRASSTPSEAPRPRHVRPAGPDRRAADRSRRRAPRTSTSAPMPTSERFFSYRRTTHRKEPDYGRQISAICDHGRT